MSPSRRPSSRWICTRFRPSSNSSSRRVEAMTPFHPKRDCGARHPRHWRTSSRQLRESTSRTRRRSQGALLALVAVGALLFGLARFRDAEGPSSTTLEERAEPSTPTATTESPVVANGGDAATVPAATPQAGGTPATPTVAVAVGPSGIRPEPDESKSLTSRVAPRECADCRPRRTRSRADARACCVATTSDALTRALGGRSPRARTVGAEHRRDVRGFHACAHVVRESPRRLPHAKGLDALGEQQTITQWRTVVRLLSRFHSDSSPSRSRSARATAARRRAMVTEAPATAASTAPCRTAASCPTPASATRAATRSAAPPRRATTGTRWRAMAAAPTARRSSPGSSARSAAAPCQTTVCGNRQIEHGETCDDGNDAAGDGCTATCQLEDGWACPIVGVLCGAAACGDGKIAGTETCDDGRRDDRTTAAARRASSRPDTSASGGPSVHAGSLRQTARSAGSSSATTGTRSRTTAARRVRARAVVQRRLVHRALRRRHHPPRLGRGVRRREPAHRATAARSTCTIETGFACTLQALRRADDDSAPAHAPRLPRQATSRRPSRPPGLPAGQRDRRSRSRSCSTTSIPAPTHRPLRVRDATPSPGNGSFPTSRRELRALVHEPHCEP